MNDDMHQEESIVLRFEDVCFATSSTSIISHVSFSCRRGYTTVILGPSGSGKTTLFQMAVGLQKPTSGCVSLLGNSLNISSKEALAQTRQRIGLLFQENALFLSLNVLDNVASPRVYVKGESWETARRYATTLIEEVGLHAHQQKSVQALSGGQQKRVALARALALEPEVVFFDEPTSGLDPQTSASIERLMQSVQQHRRCAFVVITHDVHSAQILAHDVGLLVKGELVVFAPAAEFWVHPSPFVQNFLQRKSFE